MSTQIKYAYKRHNTWVYRRTYPQHLQPLLGSSLKQSLKTADAKTAKARVAELNQTYTNIIKEAEQHVSANTGQTGAIIPDACGAAADPRPGIERPRYQSVRLLGDRRLAELAVAYLTYQAEREVPLHTALEQLLDVSLPKQGRLFPTLSVDKVVKAYAKLRIAYPNLTGTVFHSTRKWFITQCERTGVPEHYTATLVGHHSARSTNKLTYALYSGGISDAQKREIVDGIRLPDWEGIS